MSKLKAKSVTPISKPPVQKRIAHSAVLKPAKDCKTGVSQSKADHANLAAPAEIKRASKQGVLIVMLERSGGSTVAEMAEATGWQHHSVLGTISGVLRKRRGLTVLSTKEERGRVYRIAGERP